MSNSEHEKNTCNRSLKHSSQAFVSLNRNQAHNFAAQHALHSYISNSIYTFIPKNACSTLRLSLAIANGCIESSEDYNWIHQNNATFKADLEALITANYTFTVLRCPFSRLASVYLDKIINRDREAWNYIDLRQRTTHIDSITFEKFVQSLSETKVRNGDIHWRPQIDFLIYKLYDDYFCVEQFTQVVKTLKNKIGLDVIDARPLTKHGIDQFELITDENFSTSSPTLIRELKITGKCPSPVSLYNEELVQLVSQLYKCDLDLYRSLFGEDNLMFK